MPSPATSYEKRQMKYEQLAVKLKQKMHRIENRRLLAAAASIFYAAYAYWARLSLWQWLPLPFIIFLFLYLVWVHRKVKDYHNYLSALKEINQNSLKRLAGKWHEFTDAGADFHDEKHEYAHDLDLFGTGSLFQWLSTCHTGFGRKELKKILTVPPTQRAEIAARQEAIKELAAKRWWRQRFQAEAMQIPQKAKDVSRLLVWSQETYAFFSRKPVILAVRALPLVTVFTILLAFGAGIIPPFIPLFLILLHIFLYMLGLMQLTAPLKTVYNYQQAIGAYSKMLSRFEKAVFTSAYLQQLQKGLLNVAGIPASHQLQQLQKLVDRITNRENQFLAPINILLLWDYQCMVDLEQWKKLSGRFARGWLETLGKLEALSSLALINHDHPTWAIPQITAEASVFKARALAHPLLSGKRVANDVVICPPTGVLLITGSNMSGKSTLLRAAGINLVLAYAGAAVCAAAFRCSLMHLYTCMRINDNLEKGISGFYAELLRIKEILKATEQKHQVFFLLDEIFKGTNSHDRHLGAKILIKKLYSQNAIGMVSTHDLELGELERESGGKIVNFNFQEYYQDNQIFFDYKLRRGLSQTRNALYLMKMIGIEENGKS